MNGRVKELIQNIGLFTLSSFGSKVLVFLMVPLYTYVLSTEEYGMASIIQSTASLLFPLLTVEISQAVLRYCYLKDEADPNNVFCSGLRITIVGCILSVVISFILFQFPLFESVRGLFYFIPLLVTAHSFYNLLTRYSRGINRVQDSAISGVLLTFTVVVLNLFFLLVLHLGVFGYLLSYLMGDVVAACYLAIRCRVRLVIKDGSANRELSRQMLKFSLPLAPNSMSWWLLSSFNNYIILSYLGAVSVGLYSAAIRIPSILTVLADIFAQAWLLSAFNNYGSKENASFIKAMHTRYFGILSIITGLIVLLSYPIARVLLSNDFLQGWRFIPYLFVSVFLGALVGFYGSIFSAEKKNVTQLVSTLSGAGISILFVTFLLKEMGLICVPIATLIGYYVIWLIRKVRVRKYLDIGMGTLEGTLKTILLVLEATFVVYEFYVYAILVFFVVFFIHYKQFKEVMVFSINAANGWINSKMK